MPSPLGEQTMRMGGLRHALADPIALRQHVALHDRDLLEVVAQGPCREQPAQTYPKHDSGGMVVGHSRRLQHVQL